ncbi:ROK family protein [Kineococcus gynurae]|uniref:ROK family protein n=1 Tax=Kineococcus gynurae TaxID=452979 RepID=A0ABV5LV71_9ACTN
MRRLLGLVHAEPGISRAAAARALGASSGATSDLVATAVAAGWLREGDAVAHGRGRPTRSLEPSPDAPGVVGAEITHEGWRVAVVGLGGTVRTARTGRHDRRDPDAVLGAVRAAAAAVADRTPVLGLGLAVPGLVRDERRLDAPMLRWRDRDLGPALADGVGAFVAGNDATLAALGEARRGAGRGARVQLHLHLDAGVGGAVVGAGEPALGAHGLAGEYGHLPFGDPGQRCGCGARGCWGLSTGGEAMARSLGEEAPDDPVAHAHRVYERAAAGEAGARGAVAEVAAAVGRGIAGLVHALDPDRVTLGGTGVRLLELAGPDVARACAQNLMSFRALPPPELLPAALGSDASVVGAAELLWTRLLR